MKVIFKNSSVVFSNAFEGVNLLKKDEFIKNFYINRVGAITPADTGTSYYVSNKITFDKSISFNAAIAIRNEAYKNIATYAVYKKSDDSVVRVGQLGDYTSTDISSMPQIKYNEEEDKDTYVRININASAFGEGGSIEQWDARYGTYVPGGYIG